MSTTDGGQRELGKKKTTRSYLLSRTVEEVLVHFGAQVARVAVAAHQVVDVGLSEFKKKRNCKKKRKNYVTATNRLGFTTLGPELVGRDPSWGDDPPLPP